MIDLGLDGAYAIVVGAGFIPYQARPGQRAAVAGQAGLVGLWRGVAPVLSKSHISRGNLTRRLRIEATYSL